MSLYQEHINESLVAQHRQDRMREGSAERALRAMRAEEQSDRAKELTQPVGATPRPSRLRRAWTTLVNNLAPFL
jgi:hypothetical protein